MSTILQSRKAKALCESPLCLKTIVLAPVARQPMTMEAWFKQSLMMSPPCTAVAAAAAAATTKASRTAV